MKIRFHEAFREDVAGAAEYIRVHAPDSAIRFLREVDETVGRIQAYPKSAPLRLNDIRTACLPHWPYCLHYVLESQKLLVLGLYHQAQRPHLSRKRRKKRSS